MYAALGLFLLPHCAILLVVTLTLEKVALIGLIVKLSPSSLSHSYKEVLYVHARAR